MAARGIVPERLRDIAKVLPELVESRQGDPRSAVAEALKAAGVDPNELFRTLYRESLIGDSERFALFRYRLRGDRKATRAWVDVVKHGDPKAALVATFGELDVFEAVDSSLAGKETMATAALPARPTHPPPVAPQPLLELLPPEPMPVGAVAETEETSELVAPEPSQPVPVRDAERQPPPPMLAPEPVPLQVSEEPEASPPAPVTSALFGFGIDEDPDHDPWLGWPGPDPAEMRRQAALPRLVVANMPERPEELSDAELIQLLPPKRPTDVAVGWECRAHDVLRAWRVEWFRAQKLVREQSAAHDWRAHCPVRLASIRDSP
jgi:hypothetical protein